MHDFDMRDIRCVACGGENVTRSKGDESAFQCSECALTYQRVWGVPFFGQYEGEDIPGLIEIAANVVNRGKFGVNPEVVEDWERLLSSYDQSENKSEFIKSNPNAQSPFLLNRYGEWQEVTHLTRDLDLQGCKVLDMGAGLGFDSHRLSMLGADVTALEFSPVLAESGQLNFPKIRWIGGFSHCLPFKKASFDAVFCNAALHHMRDIPAAISEALRVLRPGGVLITTCDSFRPNDSDDEAELKVFDSDPTVLLGVNEGIPKFTDFVSTLHLHPNLLEVELYTHTLYNTFATLTELTRWDWNKDEAMLSKRNGSLAMRVRLKSCWPEPDRLQVNNVLAADKYVSWMSSAAVAVAKLASLMPSHYVDLPFPGTKGSKFELLNGWRAPKPFHQARIAYQRGRWFLSRSAEQDTIIFDLGLPTASASKVGSLAVLLNGDVCGDFPVSQGGWNRASLDVSHIPMGQVFAVEIQRNAGEGDSLDEASFVVRNRRFISTRKLPALSEREELHEPSEATVFAIIPVFNRLCFTLECIQNLKDQSYKSIRIIVADGGSTDNTVETIHAKHPDVLVLEAETELWWAGSMAMGIDHVMIESQDEEDCVLMINNDTQIPEDYVETLILASQTYDAAVGALVVDSRDASQVLDAGEYIDWASYSFPVKNDIDVDESFCDDVDVLPGRGSLVPLRMIRTAGNVDANMFPHYLADYEFFYRLKEHGFRMGICYETRILAHIEETGIIPSNGISGFSTIWRELFSRRSMSNIVDHWRFVGLHAPEQYRVNIQLSLMRRVLVDLTLRTPLRPLFIPLYWLRCLPRRIFSLIQGQRRTFALFARAIREDGISVLCNPQKFPGLIRMPLYLVASPGPLNRVTIEQQGLVVDELLTQGILRSLRVNEWYALETLEFSDKPEATKLKRFFWSAWNPLRKFTNSHAWKDLLKKVET
ncbi:MAG: methyltransferase [Zetaproteobacteria bacterium CG_4_9_14_3_um_filter_49_83]|nr:MAG: methyltransferase [Zetaproteobacteria bacterium CG1_02_49_23]PIQ33871.1 MAG: methyltransferase [Zetaproteobacteria bacterium CG17_big_fil_post_rev_8_21_14_2_50_50_13]PIV30667.1 MAG: methyltransferase [Zetaproteobacteria bacterium CG02_land_8_20_14_3_00_50_9]PIY55780.1 MAG: methyltransferase [Zetaproteobacteria bacterium CG_4_10_14_0_8_um_filter_49_80]PJA36160.1 MAG: methyltransferase [Zetaproteobacteria bacterium CG_4_9_14_3_um_filter_49_83]